MELHRATCLPYTTPAHEGVGDVSPPSSSPLPIPSSSVVEGAGVEPGGSAGRKEGSTRSVSQVPPPSPPPPPRSPLRLSPAAPSRRDSCRRSCCLVSDFSWGASEPALSRILQDSNSSYPSWRLLLRFLVPSSSLPVWHTQGQLHVPFTGTRTTVSTPELGRICPERSESPSISPMPAERMCHLRPPDIICRQGSSVSRATLARRGEPASRP